ncbi:flagellar hook-associated protein 1 [Azospirillum sp. B510]|uniref:flagellar hook-associated protein FlgK n=1 Tax=Azospirillum sp. (strain B510) TaxID=137722 RepID=UPI0001C4BFF6|nr:flagellar hook-associated protein FlgK [Azospirillum sp. B510]BAI72360.1 flagellar hook-associated protein 1 [Azospirillum sp. B510]
MSSLLSALQTATASLRAVQTNVSVVSGNIAKANDPTRTRHVAQQPLDGNGQTATSYRRDADEVLKGQVEALTARESGAATQAGYMRELGGLLRTSGGKPLLNSYASSFQAAWKTLEASPESRTAKIELVRAADRFAGEIRRVSDGVETLGRSMQTDLKNSVAATNGLLKEIAALNERIGSGKDGDAALSAMDRRDQLIKELNGYIGVRSMTRGDGRVALFTGSGMMLLDATPVTLTTDGNSVRLSSGEAVDGHVKDGKIGALMSMLRDGSTADPPKPADGEPTAEVIRKLRSQLDGLAQGFVGETRPGEPKSFRDAYDEAKPAKSGEAPAGFFQGKDRFTLAVKPSLLDERESVKTSALSPVVRALNATGRQLDADGLKTSDSSYTGMVSAFTGSWATAAKAANDQQGQEKAALQLVDERYHAKTGVNLDEEIATLQQLQTAYAASARILQTVKAMHDTLESLLK